ncbi:hypothetical protein [Verrucosispora sp. WMMD1129]|uniref:hypothetical protein n=1 Tax=Verrucosispora sp. WMMD1129 TaxID=3016093 RepID=UPI00249C3C83|nr:hypothetical protein [Verrucosispora sp. WMMD1129]
MGLTVPTRCLGVAVCLMSSLPSFGWLVSQSALVAGGNWNSPGALIRCAARELVS